MIEVALATKVFPATPIRLEVTAWSPMLMREGLVVVEHLNVQETERLIKALQLNVQKLYKESSY